MLTQSPFEDLLQLVEQLPPIDFDAQGVLQRQFALEEGKPSQSLTEILAWLAGWQGKAPVSIRESHICLFTSSYQGAANLDEVITFADKAGKGQTEINQVCKDKGLGLRVLELAPTLPFSVEESWTEQECMAACAFGMEATAAGGDLLGLSAVSAGSDEVAKNLVAALDGISADERNGQNILQCLRLNAGREIAALLGGILAARSRRLPVILEGWAALAAAFVLWSIKPSAVDHVRVAALTDEQQQVLCNKMSVKPILNLINSLPSGCGIAVAVSAISPLTSLQ